MAHSQQTSISTINTHRQPPHSQWSIIGLLVGCVIFGLGSLIVAHLAIGGFAMSFWRLAVAGVIFKILTVLFKQTFPDDTSPQSLQKGLIFSLISGVFLGLDLALWHESIYAVGPGISTLLNSLQIFFLAAIGFWVFKERQTILQLISLFIALAGVALIASPEFSHNKQAAYGFITGITSAGMLAASMMFIRLTHQAVATPILILMQRISIGGSVAMIIPMLLFDRGHILPHSLSELGWIFVYGSVMQCLAWGLIAYSIPKISLAVTGLILLSEPVAALVIDYFILDKAIAVEQWVGALLTMTAIYIGSLKPRAIRQKDKLRRYRFSPRFYRRR